MRAQQEEAVRNAPRVKAALRTAVESQRGAIEASLTSNVEVGQSFLQVLDTLFLIWPTVQTPELYFDDSHIKPWYNWARFKVDAAGSFGNTGVAFYFFFGKIRATGG